VTARLRLLVLMLVVIAGASIVGCGEDDSEKAGEAAAAVYHEIGNDDAEAFCDLLSDPVRDQLAELRIGFYVDAEEVNTCEAKFERFENSFDPERVKDAEVADVVVEGDRATVALVFDEDQRLEGAPEAPKRVRLAMIEEDGEWRLEKLLIPEPPTTQGIYNNNDDESESQ